MTDFFKSAFGLFGNSGQSSQQPNGIAGPGSSASNASSSAKSSLFGAQTNEFVGKSIMIGSIRLRVNRVLAEGGYAIVYLVQDVGNGAEYALKRIFSADEASNKAIREEISYLKKLVGHPNIINFVAAACEESDNSRTKEFLILSELCKEPLIDHLRAGLALPSGAAFNSEQVLNLFYQICKSVQYLHSQEPPIIHRDLKVNIFAVFTKLEVF